VRADFRGVPHDDVAALRSAADAAGEELAAIVIEPVVERLPSPEWMATARALCDRVGAVLVFDEVKTGFRLRPGGYGELSGVAPDLAVFGKAMANGHPLAAVVGNAEVMDAARATWISSTLASETLALAAASAVLDRHAQEDVCAALARIGAELRDAVARALAASGATGVTLDGLPQMWFLRWGDARRQARFVEKALERGVLFKRGAYNFAALAHDDEAILTAVELAASGALLAVREESGVSSHD
jgi:glutamate-1-semialdehyde 2,1-aminomutase